MNAQPVEPVSTAAIAPWLGDRSFEDCWSEYETLGYVVFENVMSAAECERKYVPHSRRF